MQTGGLVPGGLAVPLMRDVENDGQYPFIPIILTPFMTMPATNQVKVWHQLRNNSYFSVYAMYELAKYIVSIHKGYIPGTCNEAMEISLMDAYSFFILTYSMQQSPS
jgi:hypothetical protein